MTTGFIIRPGKRIFQRQVCAMEKNASAADRTIFAKSRRVAATVMSTEYLRTGP